MNFLFYFTIFGLTITILSEMHWLNWSDLFNYIDLFHQKIIPRYYIWFHCIWCVFQRLKRSIWPGLALQSMNPRNCCIFRCSARSRFQIAKWNIPQDIKIEILLYSSLKMRFIDLNRIEIAFKVWFPFSFVYSPCPKYECMVQWASWDKFGP